MVCCRGVRLFLALEPGPPPNLPFGRQAAATAAATAETERAQEQQHKLLTGHLAIAAASAAPAAAAVEAWGPWFAAGAGCCSLHQNQLACPTCHLAARQQQQQQQRR
jgi:hypothetical protein